MSRRPSDSTSAMNVRVHVSAPDAYRVIPNGVGDAARGGSEAGVILRAGVPGPDNTLTASLAVALQLLSPEAPRTATGFARWLDDHPGTAHPSLPTSRVERAEILDDGQSGGWIVRTSASVCDDDGATAAREVLHRLIDGQWLVSVTGHITGPIEPGRRDRHRQALRAIAENVRVEPTP